MALKSDIANIINSALPVLDDLGTTVDIQKADYAGSPGDRSVTYTTVKSGLPAAKTNIRAVDVGRETNHGSRIAATDVAFIIAGDGIDVVDIRDGRVINGSDTYQIIGAEGHAALQIFARL